MGGLHNVAAPNGWLVTPPEDQRCAGSTIPRVRFFAAKRLFTLEFDCLSGAFYLIWLALQAWRTPTRSASKQAQAASTGRIFVRAALNSLLNPKALLFFMVLLPQFVHAERGHATTQLALLGLILSCAALVFNCLPGPFGGQIGAALVRHPGAVRAQRWLLSGVLIALAVLLFILDRPASR